MTHTERFIDISREVDDSTVVFPGDTPFRRSVLLDIDKGDHITLSTVQSTVHLATHADGPNHYGAGGRAIDEQPIDLYIGRCQVIRVDVARGSRVGFDDLGGVDIEAERVLLATGSHPDTSNWNPDFNGLEPDLVDRLSSLGVRLVGIDTPSVDSADSKDLPAHQRFFANDMAIIEGLELEHVEPGCYELIALPLRLKGFDGSPVRAILRCP